MSEIFIQLYDFLLLELSLRLGSWNKLMVKVAKPDVNKYNNLFFARVPAIDSIVIDKGAESIEFNE